MRRPSVPDEIVRPARLRLDAAPAARFTWNSCREPSRSGRLVRGETTIALVLEVALPEVPTTFGLRKML